MSRQVKRLTITLYCLAGLCAVLLGALQFSLRHPASAEAAIITAPDFSLTDQLNRTVSTSDLRGHPWIADFIFTECASACPLMTRHLSDLQSKIPADVKFVSFSVDPLHDTPAALLGYAAQYGADNERWRFLTGDSARVMDAVRGMKVSIVPPVAGSNQIEHDIHFLLMDSAGNLHGTYDSRFPDEMNRLIADAAALPRSRP